VIAIRLGRLLPVASSNLPGHLWQDHQCCCAAMPLHGLASDGVYLASSVTRVAVRSYRTFSPLPGNKSTGGLFSVALSLEVALAGRYPAPWSCEARTFLWQGYPCQQLSGYLLTSQQI